MFPIRPLCIQSISSFPSSGNKSKEIMLQKIVTGGQTGVDRAAFDIAISLDLEYGGWSPKGKKDELGTIPHEYNKNMLEVPGRFKNYKESCDARTRKNIQDSDGTLIIIPKQPIPKEISDGTIIMEEEAKLLGKAYLIIDISKSIEINNEMFIHWMKEKRIKILNIGGPRESSWPGIYEASLKFLESALPLCKKTDTLRAKL